MSIKALSWALDQECGRSSLKLVLLLLANYANEDSEAYPSISRLENISELDRKTVIECLNELQSLGHISDTGKVCGATKRVKVYRLNYGENAIVPKTESFLFSHPNSPKNGTVNSPKNGTQNLKGNQSKEQKERYVFPEVLNDIRFHDAWDAWLRHCKQKKKTPTEEASKAKWEELAQIGVDRAVAAIKHSVANNYTGIFEPKSSSSQTKNGSGPKPAHERTYSDTTW